MRPPFIVALYCVPILIWIVYWILAFWLAGDLAKAGQFGDMFGAVNALFSGMAIAGLFATYLAQKRNHGAEMEKLETQLTIERRRAEFEARPIFTLRWRDSSVQQNKSQFGLIVSNHGSPIIFLQYTLNTTGAPAESGGIFQTCLNGKDVESPTAIASSIAGILEYGYVQLRDGRRGTATFDILDSRHREPRFVVQRPGILLGSSITTEAGKTWDNLPRIDVFKEYFEEVPGPSS